jgi:hypothetical protein
LDRESRKCLVFHLAEKIAATAMRQFSGGLCFESRAYWPVPKRVF